MNANELRIGNWVEFTGEWSYRKYEKGALFQWDASDWYALGECTMSLEDLAPIPITEEVLVKCGFELMPWGFVFKGNDFALLLAWNQKGKFWVEIGNGTKIYFSYLHQLQNMLQLCGQELTYTP